MEKLTSLALLMGAKVVLEFVLIDDIYLYL